MNNSYLKEKFNHKDNVIDAINLLESNYFQIDLAFGGEIENIIDSISNKIVTADSVWDYPKHIQDAILLLNEIN